MQPNVKKRSKFVLLVAIGAFSLLLLVAFQPSQPVKRFKLELDLQQTQMIFAALADCDCPQKSALALRKYISEEYSKQFPILPKADTTAGKPKH